MKLFVFDMFIKNLLFYESGVGVAKAPLVDFSVRDVFDICHEMYLQMKFSKPLSLVYWSMLSFYFLHDLTDAKTQRNRWKLPSIDRRIIVDQDD